MSTTANKINFGQLDTNVESRLGFKPSKEILNGLCIGKIISAEVVESDISATNEDGTPSTWEMAGKKTYSLLVTYKQVNNDPKDTSERIITQRETVVSSTLKNGDPLDVKTWTNLVTNSYARMQHLVNAFDKANITPIGKKVPEVSFGYDDAPEVRIAAMKKVYEHYAAVLNAPNAEKKPRFEDVSLWMRVVAEPVKGTYYVIPSFVQKGIFEVLRKGINPIIELLPSDSIELTKKSSKKNEVKPDVNYNDKDAAPAVNASASVDDVLRQMGLA